MHQAPSLSLPLPLHSYLPVIQIPAMRQGMHEPSAPGMPRNGRLDLHETADRWLRARRAVPASDQPHAERLAEMIRAHATDRLSVIEDPLEAAMFSLLVELVKEPHRGE